MNPLISVIIPTHNCAKTLGVALQSIIDQTYQPLEVIVVNDRSTDETEEVMAPFLKKYSFVTLLTITEDDPERINKRGRNVNAGYNARNVGLAKAQGEWITFQDADDASLLNRIDVQYKLAQEYQALHVCTQWQGFAEGKIGKQLDVDRIFKEKKDIVIPSPEIVATAKRAKGPIIPLLGSLNEKIPFEWKRLRVIHRLFFGTLEPYPASGNSPLFHRSILERVQFRPLQQRIWPSFAGRGADRDFNFQVAETFKRSWSFSLPLYLWRCGRENPDFAGYENYLI